MIDKINTMVAGILVAGAVWVNLILGQFLIRPVIGDEVVEIENKDTYTIIFVGDSMTASWGKNFDSLRPKLTEYFPNKNFGLFNYSEGSTNILTLETLLDQETKTDEGVMPPILERDFDIIIIESFGHNPLSDLPLEAGLKKQTEVLDKIVSRIRKAKPKALIVLMTPIAPSATHYAEKVVELSDEIRQMWVKERVSYIENHRTYAGEHLLPLIDVFEMSLDENKEVKLELINRDDYIHPSKEGLELMSQTTVDYLKTVFDFAYTPRERFSW